MNTSVMPTTSPLKSTEAVTNLLQGEIGPQTPPDLAAGPHAPSIEVSDTTHPWSDSPRHGSEPVPHPDHHGTSPTLPAYRYRSLPPAVSSEDLSTLPALIAAKLHYSTQLSLSTACVSASSPQYELVQEEYVPGQMAAVATEVKGEFRSRHTANCEAAKMFVHRFWKQVVAEKRAYEVYLEEAGILTLTIKCRDAQGQMRANSVFVQRKGGPGARATEGPITTP